MSIKLGSSFNKKPIRKPVQETRTMGSNPVKYKIPTRK